MMLITRQPDMDRNVLILCGIYKGRGAAMSFMQGAVVR